MILKKTTMRCYDAENDKNTNKGSDDNKITLNIAVFRVSIEL